ncbi:MAG: transcription antitermination factor NusB [Phycisphaerae bacterium]
MNKQKQTSNAKFHIPKVPGLDARFLAFQSLQDTSIKTLPTDRIWLLAEKFDLPFRERSFAYELLSGCIKHRASLDHLIELFSSRNVRQIASAVLTLLRLGVYQLVYEDRVPDFAAVDTTCELAKGFLGRPQVGFINAILRGIQRGIEGRGIEISAENIRFVLPTRLNTGIKFFKEILSAIDVPANYLSPAYSYPKWLVARWLSKWDFDTLKQILAAGNARPGLVCRPNRGKLDSPAAEKLAEILTQQSCQVKVLPDSESVMLIENPPITELEAFREGLFQIQDPTACDVIRNLSLQPGIKILDLCAGLGTKTTQLAEVTNDQAEIYASDRIASKLDKLKQNAERLGLESIKTIVINELISDQLKNFFDIVLLDVPCSNTGVFDRRPEARWRLKESDFQTYSRQSLKLLNQAENLVKPTGQIVFSTCSIDDEENADLIARFCRQTNWRVTRQHMQLPQVDPATEKNIRTGGYWACLEKRTT